MPKMLITDLNVDCLLHIFKYCSIDDLGNLTKANSYLQNVIEVNILEVRSRDLLMCGHRNSPTIQMRTLATLTHWDRFKISRNWLEGRYNEREYFRHAVMFPTKLHLQRDSLFLSHTSYIRQYRRSYREALEVPYKKEYTTNIKTDIAAFTIKQDTIFAGHVCGSCFVYDDDYVTEQYLHSPKEYLYCLDFARNLYMTSSNVCAKIWRRSEQFGLVHLDLGKEIKQSYKAIRFSDNGDRLYGGLYTDMNRHALREIDVETGSETILNSDTISIYDLKLKDDNIVFTANFDTTFRLHDRRSNRDEWIWEDPFDSSFYCLEYDGLYAVLCGTKYHSRVNLYDIRMPHKHRQLYFPFRNRNTRSSPVYSIACDSQYLFVATDHSVRVFDFKNDSAYHRDYSNIFTQYPRTSFHNLLCTGNIYGNR